MFSVIFVNIFECDLEQIIQGCYGVSIIGDTQTLSGHGPEQPALGETAWTGKAGPGNNQSPFQP